MSFTELSRDEVNIPGESKHHTATPYFRHENIFNEPQSRIHGRPIHDLKEVVEIRFAANPQYKPVFGVEEFQSMDESGRGTTWAEHYKKQYAAFTNGVAQEADGTPLEELIPYGISQAQLSICRALSIYSVEALHHLEGAGVKRLGLNGNDLKPMAKRYLDARRDGSQAQTEINELKRQLAAFRDQMGMGEEPILSNEMAEKEPELPEGYEEMTDEELKAKIKLKVGAAPRGNPARSTLISMFEQAHAA